MKSPPILVSGGWLFASKISVIFWLQESDMSNEGEVILCFRVAKREIQGSMEELSKLSS